MGTPWREDEGEKRRIPKTNPAQESSLQSRGILEIPPQGFLCCSAFKRAKHFMQIETDEPLDEILNMGQVFFLPLV